MVFFWAKSSTSALSHSKLIQRVSSLISKSIYFDLWISRILNFSNLSFCSFLSFSQVSSKAYGGLKRFLATRILLARNLQKPLLNMWFGFHCLQLHNAKGFCFKKRGWRTKEKKRQRVNCMIIKAKAYQITKTPCFVLFCFRLFNAPAVN